MGLIGGVVLNIILDVMGGDYSPREQVLGAMRAASEGDFTVTLVGDSELINKELEGYEKDNIKVIHADSVITNDEEPALAVRRKKDSSVVIAAKEVSEGRGDALVSCGSTGAVLSAGILIIGRVKGVLRPALAPVIPTRKEPVLLLDCGANADCKPENLVQFAKMGSIYMKDVLKRDNPRVCLANIGAEEHKGNSLMKESYGLLKESSVNFIGNIEGRDMLNGDCDVVVADGFTGNIILKLTEGVTSHMVSMIKNMLMSSIKTKLAAVMIKNNLKEFKKSMDYEEYGGALLLGVKAPVIKCHGASKEKSVYYGIMQAAKCIESGMVETISKSIIDAQM